MKNHGFTLLEILIALFIFTIVSMILVTALHTVINTQSATDKKAERLAQLQVTLLLMSRDIEQTINRPITNAAGAQEGFMGASNSITFTHAGLPNPNGELNRSTLQRTRYSLDNETLIRTTWPVLDPTPQTIPDHRSLLKAVTALRFMYLDNEGHTQSSWPPAGQKTPLPRAVRVFMTLKNQGQVSQVFVIPGGRS